MPRKGTVERREVGPDPVYGNPLVQKLINCVMYQGKKSRGPEIVYDSFELIRQRANDDPLKVFKKAVENVKPALEVKSRRVGGANYQVPVEVNRNRQTSLSLRWIIGYARERGEKSMVERLAAELLDAANNQAAAPSRSGTIPTAWPRPTRLLLITAGNPASCGINLEQGGMWRLPGPRSALQPPSIGAWLNSIAGVPDLSVRWRSGLVSFVMSTYAEKCARENTEYRHHGPHRCR